MADSLEPAQFDDGQVVIRQGDPGEDFFIIVEVCAFLLSFLDRCVTDLTVIVSLWRH